MKREKMIKVHEIQRLDQCTFAPKINKRKSTTPRVMSADLNTDEHLHEWARQAAPKLLEKYPDMAERHIARWLGGKSEYLKA